jgi:hypothetical protein
MSMNDDTLTLYYYNDGLTAAERQAVANALATDPELARRYEALSRELGRLEDPEVPGPPADMVQRWHDGLDRAIDLQSQKRDRPSVHSWSFLLGAAVTAALAIGVGIGLFLGGDDSASPVMQELTAESDSQGAAPSGAFIRGLELYLRESEQGLAAMPASTAADRNLLIMNIIEQNRMFERAAEQNDSDNLARILRAFELVLLQLTAEDISEEEAEALRTKLLFELNVVLTKLARDTSEEQQTI